MQEEAAAAQAQAAKDQVWRKAAETDQTEGLDLSKTVTAFCPHCGAKTGAGKFCGECGKELRAAAACPSCNAKLNPGARFCGECGRKLG